MTNVLSAILELLFNVIENAKIEDSPVFGSYFTKKEEDTEKEEEIYQK